jgi:hypothetical protein
MQKQDGPSPYKAWQVENIVKRREASDQDLKVDNETSRHGLNRPSKTAEPTLVQDKK